MTISRSDAAFLLRRAGFGGTAAEINALATASDWSAAVERLLDTSANPPENPPASASDTSAEYLTRWADATEWWIEKMRTTPTPLVEKMALFWHGHFASSADKVGMTASFDQIRLYRTQGLGNFRNLVQKMAVHPAMLEYLDNVANYVGGEDENFAREVMELFTMGNFTFAESDVISMARAWTGHGRKPLTGEYEFHPDLHDTGQKTLFGITKNWDGPDALDEICLRSKQPVMAKFIAGKLWSFFAAPNPSPALVTDLANAFVAGGLEIKPLLRAIFNRPEFRSTAVRTGRLRTPVEWVVAVLKALDLPASAATPEWTLGAMGQRPFRPPNVAGWGANAYWLSTSSIWGRAQFIAALRWIATDTTYGYNRLPGLKDKTPDQIVDAAVTTFGLVDATPKTKAAIRAWAVKTLAASNTWTASTNLIPLVTLSPDFGLA